MTVELSDTELQVLASYSESIGVPSDNIVSFLLKDAVVQWAANSWRSGVEFSPEIHAQLDATRAELAALRNSE